MQYRELPGAQLQVSRVCLGTMTFGSQVDEAGARGMIDRCLEAGVNFFDTANNYNQGRSEEILGHIFRGRRDRVILASKVFNKTGDAPDDRGLSRAAIRKALEASLRRLQTD
jgi:aryl-alcohol dehydrogenase-like predicted oxidoreductase